jgi:hypothetical protein
LALSDSTAGIAPRRAASFAPPTRASALLFAAKAFAFQARRLVEDRVRGPARLTRVASGGGVLAAHSRTPLWGDTRASERALQWGKVHNLRLAARALDGTRIPAGAVFSFWKQLGRPGRARGFVDGRMLREGCLVPSAGGGLCQISNALFEVALAAGCEIVERHAHSRIVPGSVAAVGRDATVAWNYVDLRFRPERDLVLRVTVERDVLDVRLLAEAGTLQRAVREPTASQAPQVEAESCGSCDETACFRHEGHREAPAGRTAFLVDESWPEFRSFVARAKKDGDVLGLPASRAPRYAWDTGGFARIGTASLATAARGAALRFVSTAPLRRALELRSARWIAHRLSRLLTPDVTEVCVAQSLLPHLWRAGHLGGRKFSVLMTRLPMGEIQARLDAAARAHPERKTLSDFRADPALIAAEAEALAAADTIVTPHCEIARLFGERADLLEWQMPKPAVRALPVVSRRIAFPGPTIARKGAYELRETARALDLEIVLLGSELEGSDFWNGVRTLRPSSENWLDGVACVVQPALLEDAPRRLLQALASGVPVIATRACGLPAQDGLVLAPEDDEAALALLISSIPVPPPHPAS